MTSWTDDEIGGTVWSDEEPTALTEIASSQVSFAQSGTGAITQDVQTVLREGMSVTNFGVVGDGSTDDATNLQKAIDAANVVGALAESTVELRVPKGLIVKVGSTIVPKSFVALKGTGGRIKWSGSTTGTMFDNGTSGILQDASFIDLDIDAAAITGAGTVFKLRSPYKCTLRDIDIEGSSSTSFVLDIVVNTTGGTNPATNRNAALNTFDNVIQSQGTCGTFIRLQGGSSASEVVTLNTFHNCQALSCAVRGIDFAKWCDNNYFTGMTRVSIDANDAVGAEWNTGTPGSNVGVYSNNFDHLAVDSFNTKTGRVAAKMNWTKLNVVNFLFNDPAAEGGSVVVDATNTLSYRINHNPAGTNNTRILEKASGISFYAKISAAQTFTGAKTKVDFGTEVVDTGSAYDNSAMTFTAPVAGTYAFDVVLQNTTGVTLGDVWSLTLEAGSNTFGSEQYVIANSRGGAALKLSATAQLAASETVIAYVTRISGTGNYVELANATFNYIVGRKID